jgi:hypothetical protein
MTQEQMHDVAILTNIDYHNPDDDTYLIISTSITEWDRVTTQELEALKSSESYFSIKVIERIPIESIKKKSVSYFLEESQKRKKIEAEKRRRYELQEEKRKEKAEERARNRLQKQAEKFGFAVVELK